MSAKAHPKPDDPEQSRRFIEMAQEHDADGDSDALARAVKKLATAPREPKEKEKKKDAS